MNRTVGTLRQLFDLLLREQQRSWYEQRRGRKPSRDAQQLWQRLVPSLKPIEETVFEHWFPASSDELHVDFSQRQMVLYLPPLEKDAEFVPILDVKCDLDGTRTEIELRVLLVRQVEDCKTNGEGKLRCIGFRLESPHGDREQRETEEGEKKVEGRHDFYHAQLIRGLRWGPAFKSPDWLPCTQPSLPLTANCPVTLVLCLLLTLYGKGYCREFVSKPTGLSNWLKPYLEKLQPWVNLGALA